MKDFHDNINKATTRQEAIKSTKLRAGVNYIRA